MFKIKLDLLQWSLEAWRRFLDLKVTLTFFENHISFHVFSVKKKKKKKKDSAYTCVEKLLN